MDYTKFSTNMTDEIKREIKQYNNHCILALKDVANANEGAFNNFRKSGEAICKIYILKKWGDVLGLDIIYGRKNENGDDLSTNREPRYSDLISILKKNRLTDRNTTNKLYILKEKGDLGSHDPNRIEKEKNMREEANFDVCKSISKDLTLSIYTFLRESLPENLMSAYGSEVEAREIEITDPYERFLNYIDDFDENQKYVLIAPDSFDDCSKAQISNLSRLPWSFIIDFDSNSKKDGLYKSFPPSIEHSCTPITIAQKDQNRIMGTGAKGHIDWFFANGLASMPNTVTNNLSMWLNLKCHKFLEKLMKEYCSISLNSINIIILLEDKDYLRHILYCLEYIDELNKDTIKIAFISCDDTIDECMNEACSYGFKANIFKITKSTFLSKISDFAKSDEYKNSQILVPARSSNGNEIIDISDIENYLLNAGIFVVHKNIAKEIIDKDPIPQFYKGETITWEELTQEIDVRRTKYQSIYKKIKSNLDTSKHSVRFSLQYSPGAGGTTLSRRLAYDLRTIYPTTILQNIVKENTATQIGQLYTRVKMPILCIVEFSDISKTDLHDLIIECNKNKRIIVFVTIERMINCHHTTDIMLTEHFSDKIADNDEKNRFLRIVKYYSNTTIYNELFNRPFNECEVIDFALSISENQYEKKRICSYIRSYLNELPEELVSFITHVSLIYYYSQKRVSENLFRNLFCSKNGSKIGLTEYLKSHPNENNFLQKILVRDRSTNSNEYWRPRYSLFAEIIVKNMINESQNTNWAEQIPEFAKSLIKIIKENNEYLVDESRDVLKSVFLERGKENVLGVEEEWKSSTSNDQFSQLMQDIGDKPEEQKSILKLLATSFPQEAHFWAHLGRYCYEKANSPKQFDEAMGYIDNAFNANGKTDFNLQHIAGMCKRRLIEYYKREKTTIPFSELRDITIKSKEYFKASRQINSKNIYAYISEIQLCCIVIEYGKSLSSFRNYRDFLMSPSNSWYLDQYIEMLDLIDEANILINQLATLGIDRKINISRAYLSQSEFNSVQFTGKDKETLSFLKNKIEIVQRCDRPKFRIIYIKTLLLSKVKENSEELYKAWKLLDRDEVEVIGKFLDINIQQDPANLPSLRYWFMYARYSNIVYSIEEVISRLKMIYNHSEGHQIMQLESSYYIYILYAFQLIKDGDALNTKLIDETNKWINICRKLSPNDKYSFEWLGGLNSFKDIINARYLKNNYNKLQRITGTISWIKSEAQGTIILPCKLNCFFVPSVGKFYQGQDETTKVSCQIGFRHDGLCAFEVKRVDDCKPLKEENTNKEEEVNEELNIENVEPLVKKETKENKQDKTEIFEPSKIKKPKVNILGKIDLDKINYGHNN